MLASQVVAKLGRDIDNEQHAVPGKEVELYQPSSFEHVPKSPVRPSRIGLEEMQQEDVVHGKMQSG